MSEVGQLRGPRRATLSTLEGRGLDRRRCYRRQWPWCPWRGRIPPRPGRGSQIVRRQLRPGQLAERTSEALPRHFVYWTLGYAGSMFAHGSVDVFLYNLVHLFTGLLVTPLRPKRKSELAEEPSRMDTPHGRVKAAQ